MPSVAVVMGGSPEEHEPSLATGRACSEALCAIGYDVREVVYACNDFPSSMRSLSPSPDVVFNALHGSFGEDGCIQGLLELLGESVRKRVVAHSGTRLSWEVRRFGEIPIPTPPDDVDA